MKARIRVIGIAVLVVCSGRLAGASDVIVQPAAPLASVPLLVESGGALDVSVQIAGRPAKLRVDTSDALNNLTETSATTLGLPRDHISYSERMWMVSSNGVFEAVTEYATAKSVRFGEFDAPETKFYVVGDDTLPFNVAGKVGEEFLRQFDIEFDFPRQKLNIYSPGQCANIWPAGGATLVELDVDGKGRTTFDVELDGKPAKALLNTASSLSILGLNRGKELFGFSEKTPGLKALATRNGFAYRLSYPFKTLVLQGVTVANPDIEVFTTVLERPDLIIGANILRLLHFCVAYDSEKMYVALPATH